MAVSLQFPVSSSIKTVVPSPTSVQSKEEPVSRGFFSFPSKTRPLLKISGNSNKNRLFKGHRRKHRQCGRASVTMQNCITETAKEVEAEASTSEASKLSEIGAEIQKAMKEREGNNNLASGVAEEIKEIEWPAFGKVLGTTSVVLGVIAGSSVVLPTVNVVLAELSDRVFAGKGVQDFFN